MKTIQFKSNINCNNCIAKVTPTLNETIGKDNWQVDIENPEKILQVKVDKHIDPSVIINAIKKTGFKVELLHQE